MTTIMYIQWYVNGKDNRKKLEAELISGLGTIEFQIMILARPEGGIEVSRTHSTSSTIPTDNAVQNLYLEVYRLFPRSICG